jgi:hypothetical protein
MTRPSLDWKDARAFAEWFRALKVSLNDSHAVALDMLRAPRERELGPALHAKNYGDAWSQIAQAIEYATPPDPDDDGEPGGAGSTH